MIESSCGIWYNHIQKRGVCYRIFKTVRPEPEGSFCAAASGHDPVGRVIAFICLLSFDAYLKKQLVERLIDETLSDEAKQKKDK